MRLRHSALAGLLVRANTVVQPVRHRRNCELRLSGCLLIAGMEARTARPDLSVAAARMFAVVATKRA